MWKHKNFINLQLCAGETWVLNETVDIPTQSFTVNFGSNGRKFKTIKKVGIQIYYDDVHVYVKNTPDGIHWVSGEAYRTLTFAIPPTGDLLTWLQANGTKQSAPTPTLTFKHFYDAGTIGSGTVKFRHYSQQEPTPSGYTDCLTFTGETSDFTLKATYKEWDGTLEWSTDHTNWTTLTGTEAMQSVGKKLYLRGKGNTKFKTSIGIAWRLSAKAGCSGNIQTLLDWESPPTSISTGSCYEAMFWNCTNLTTAPELPATTLAQNCYNALFSGCTNLTTAPELPATTLANYCYRNMFVRCSNLTTAPELPATTLAEGCYYSMFSSCTNLTTAPALPATKLADDCYNSMFNNCTKLKLSTTQTTEYKTAWRIPSSGTISNTSTMWSRNMLKDTGGTFTGDPSINRTYYGAW